mgnify:CR=1 FL=1
MNIYFEVENYNREMESRMLISMEAAINDHIAYITHRVNLLSNASKNKIEPGVIFLKDANTTSYVKNLLISIKKNGFFVICTDEEAGIQFDKYCDFITTRTLTNLDSIDVFICWGLRDKTELKNKFKKDNVKFLALGSARLDLCKTDMLKKKKFLELKKKIDKKYILISSNISFPIGIRRIEDFISVRLLADDIEREFKEKYIYYKYANHLITCYYLVKLIKKLANKYKDYIIVLRPHPNEKISTWEKLLVDNFSNIKIIKSGFLAEYIYNSEITIHTRCTTGIESFIMDKPSISYVPKNFENSFEGKFSDDLSVKCISEDDVINTINNFEKIKIKDNTDLNYRIINPKYSKTYKKINSLFNIIAKKKNYVSFNCDGVLGSEKNIKIYLLLKSNIKKIIYKLLKIKIETPPFYEKFPPIRFKEINAIFSELKTQDKKYENLKIKILDSHTVKIFK